ncbi:MAG TPA: elongation factor Ts, partial [Promineifilum sp.]|nr:elongation factor Ts [Promineifilum sp.]
LNKEDVPTQELDRETSVLKAQALAEGKPEAVIEKVISGRIAKFYEEMCLMEQPFIKDEKIKIKEMMTDAISSTGENIIVRRFARYELGEALED